MRDNQGGSMRGLVVVALGTTLFVAGCKKTVEGENKAWDRNIAKVNELATLYPGFANALRAQQKAAEDAMAQARSVGDKEAAAKAMSNANAMIDSGWVYSLSQIESKKRNLSQKIVTATTETEHGADQAAAKAVSDDAQRILKNVDDGLKAGAADGSSAQVLLAKMDGDISAVSSNLDRVIDSAKKRKAEAAKATAPGAATPGAAAANAPAQKVQWKCTYCNHMNDDARQKCENCGAPRAAAKTPPAAKKK
jgi:hypothetical protein